VRLVAAALAGALVAAPQTFRTTIDAVRVDVLVTDGHRPIEDLRIGDFELKDNGVVQTLRDAEIRDVPFSMLLALDTSSSVRGNALADLKKAARAALDALHPDDRVELLTFTDAVRPRTYWQDDRAAALAAIDRTEAGGSTSLFDAAYVALSLRDPDPSRRSLIVLFTDGVDSTSWLPADAAYDRAARSDSVVYAVHLPDVHTDPRHLYARSGITLSESASILPIEGFLGELTHRTGGDLLLARGTAALAATFQQIVEQFRTRYLLTYQPTGVSPNGWHQLEVSVKRRGAKVTARRGYQR
jgi:VWFA-related protein